MKLVQIKKYFLKIKPTHILIAIILVGAFLRLFALNWGLPILIHPDEGTHIKKALIYGQTLNFNPVDFYWPAFLSYVYFIFYVIFIIILLATGMVGSISELGNLFLHNEAQILPYFFIISRLISFIFSIATIYYLYRAVRNFFGEKAALYSALIYSLLPLAVREAHFATKDTPSVFFIVFALFHLSEYLRKRQKKHLYFSAIGIGFAISCIYTVALSFLIIPIFLAFDNLDKLKGSFFSKIIEIVRKNLRLILTLASITLLTFLIFNPYTIIKYEKFTKDLTDGYGNAVMKNVAEKFGKTDFRDNTIFNKTFILLPFSISLGFFLLLPFSIYLFFKKDKKEKENYKRGIFASFLIMLFSAYFIKTNFARYLLLTMPFVAIIIGVAFSKINVKKQRIYALFIILSIIYAAIFSFSLDLTMKNETIKQSSEYINSLYQNYTVLATEFVPNGLRVIPKNDSYLIEDKTYLKMKNPDYVLVSSEIYGRYKKNTKQSEFYNDLFKGKLGYCLTKEYSYHYLNYDIYQYMQKTNINMYESSDIFIFQKCI